VIISEHFGKNRVILMQMVANWRCIKHCAIFFDHSVLLTLICTSFGVFLTPVPLPVNTVAVRYGGTKTQCPEFKQ